MYRPDETPVRSLFGFHLEIPRLPHFFFWYMYLWVANTSFSPSQTSGHELGTKCEIGDFATTLLVLTPRRYFVVTLDVTWQIEDGLPLGASLRSFGGKNL